MEAFLSQAWREKSFVLLMVEGVPGTKRRTPRRTQTWWAREACPRIAIPMTYFVQQAQKHPLVLKDNFPNCPARRARRPNEFVREGVPARGGDRAGHKRS